MRQFIYKMVVAVIAIILVYEFTIGKQISQYSKKIEGVSSKEGRKDSLNKLFTLINDKYKLELDAFNWSKSSKEPFKRLKDKQRDN